MKFLKMSPKVFLVVMVLMCIGTLSYGTRHAPGVGQFNYTGSENFSDYNGSDYGGGLYVVNINTTVTFSGATKIEFKNNTTTNKGGGIWMIAGTLKFNSVTVDFINNKNSAMSFSGNQYQQIINAIDSTFTFSENKSNLGGGAIRGEIGGLKATFTRGKADFFNHNSGSTGGGAIWFGNADGAAMTFDGTIVSFLENLCEGMGGGAIYARGVMLTFKNGTANFSGNKATSETGYGGAIAIRNGNLTRVSFNNEIVNIINNTAGNNGGAIYFGEQQGPQILEFINSTSVFKGNSAKYGGTIYMMGQEDAKVIFNGGKIEFIDNHSTANDAKGNIMLNGNSTIEISNLTSMIARYNTSASGGFLFVPKLRFSFEGDLLEMTSNTANGTGTYGEGGSFLLDGSTVTFAGTTMTFTGNKARIGAVLFATNGASVTFKGNAKGGYLTFESNETTGGQGVISWNNKAQVGFTGLSSLIARWNKAVGGGFLNIDGANYTLGSQVIRISSNTAGSGSGGGIYLNNSAVTFSGNILEISTNIAGTNGGGMFLTSSQAEFKISSMSYTTNTASAGGGMYFQSKSTAIFTSYSMKFNVNRSTNGSGGAIYYTASRANFSPTIMSFSGNVAQVSGGGMYFINSTANFINASTMVFERNIANTQVGGAMSFELSSAIFAAKEMSFIGNQAKAGGAMFFSTANAQFINADRMSFNMNYSSGIGGGLAFNNSTVLFSPTSMTFSENMANMGGGIYLEGKSSATFSATAQMIFEANRAANGGGMSLVDARALFDTAGIMTFRANVATSSGAGMYLSGSTMTFQAETMEFLSNKADYGAVLYVTDGSKVIFTKGAVRFEHNETFSGNGVIAWDNGADVSFTGLKNLVSRYNKAEQGGFLYVEKASYELGADKIEISSNQAVGGVGGAIYLKGSSLTFNVDSGRGRLDITTNTAKTNGGGLYLEAALGQEGIISSQLEFKAGTISFSRNEAKANGGAIYLRESTITFAAGKMEFKGNEAKVGAVLYATSNSWVVFEKGAVEIRNNISDGGRGVISWDEGSQVSFRDLTSLNATENKAPEGGFLYIEGADYKLGSDEINISSNEARTGSGGAVYLINSTMSFAAATGNVHISFFGNVASQEGGAIYASQGSLITLDTGGAGEIIFSGNIARNTANDIYLSNSEIILKAYGEKGIKLMGGIKAVEGSTVSMKGEGVLYLSGVTDFDETEFKLETGNRVIVTDDGEFIYNNASIGIELSSSVMIFEKASITISGNKEGAIIAQYGSSVSFMKSRKDMRFVGNQGAKAGVVIRAVGGSTVTFSNDNTLKIENNGDTQTDSSILYWDETSQINFNGARILGKNNKAQNGVFVKLIEQDWKVNGYQLEMTGNEAAENGGVIYAQRSTVTLNTNARYISFSNNIAGGELNDIYLEDSVLKLEATNEEITMNSGIKTQGTFRLIKTGEGNATIGGIVNVEGAGGEWEIKEGRMIVNATSRDNTRGAGLGGLRGAPILQTKEALVIIGSMTVGELGTYSMIGKGIVVTSVTNELVIRGGIEIGVEAGQGWDMVADRIYASTITIEDGSYLRLKLYGANTASEIIPIMYTQWGINGVEHLKPVYSEGFFYSYEYDDIFSPKEMYIRLEVPLISLENLTHNQREVVRMLNELKGLDAIEYRLPITRRLALGEGIGALQGLDEMSGEFLANALSMGARENNKVARHAQTNTKQKDMWIEGNINGFEYKKEGNYDGAFEGNEKEILAGIDVYRTKAGAIGIFIGHGFNDIRQGESSAKVGDTKVGIYGGSFGSNTSFVGSLSGGLQQLDIERYVGIKEEKPKSNFNTYSIRFSGEVDYKFILDSQREFYVKPFAGINGGAVFNERIEEANGKITDLIIESGDYVRIEGNFGIKLELKASKMRYNGRLYGEYLLVGNKSEYEIGIAKIPKYGRMNIWGVEGKQVLGGIGIGAEYEATRNIGIYVNTDFKSSLNTFVYFVNGGVKYKFGKATTR